MLCGGFLISSRSGLSANVWTVPRAIIVLFPLSIVRIAEVGIIGIKRTKGLDSILPGLYLGLAVAKLHRSNRYNKLIIS